MELVVSRANMMVAHQRVLANKGAAGVDNMPAGDLLTYLHVHWSAIKEDLLTDRYQPPPALKVEIPKPGGKDIRQLGIPTAMDRLIQQALQQALQQVLTPILDRVNYDWLHTVLQSTS